MRNKFFRIFALFQTMGNFQNKAYFNREHVLQCLTRVLCAAGGSSRGSAYQIYKNLAQALIVNHVESFYDRFPNTKAWVDLFIQQKTLRQGLKRKLCTYLSDEFIAAYPKQGIERWFNENRIS